VARRCGPSCSLSSSRISASPKPIRGPTPPATARTQKRTSIR
jgi:hypothetical protein